MLGNKADRLLDETVRDGRTDPAEPTPRRRYPWLAGLMPAATPVSTEQVARRRDRRSDLTVAALGVTLGLICALFPWYIFFNPDEFGVRAVRFGGGGAGTAPIVLGAQPGRIGAPAETVDAPLPELDLRATGSATRNPAQEDGIALPGIADQPFPPPPIAFKVVQIANGRAMLEDDTGLFVVQAGSVLPDGVRVKTIEERDGHPVVVTETGALLEVGN